MKSSPISTSKFAPVLLAALLLGAALACSLATRAHASEGDQYGAIGQYGEVTRFGGFDSTWFDNGKYDGSGTETQPAGAKFIDPVSFAVDTHDTTPGGDGTALYVLESITGAAYEAGPSGTEWRLQKLSDTGAVLGTSEFYLPKERVPGTRAYGFYVGLIGLAIDDTSGRLYTVLYASNNEGSEATRYAEEVLGWSTTPQDGKLLAPEASGSYPALALDTISTPASGYSAPGVLSTASQLSGTPLYEPEGLALDVTGGQDDLAIAAEGAVRNGFGEQQGPAIVEQVSTASGEETHNWSAATGLAGVANSFEHSTDTFPDGITTNPDGSLNLLLAGASESNAEGQPADDVIDLQANLTSPTVASSPQLDPTFGQNPHDDQADPVETAAANSQTGGLTTLGSAQSQVVALSNGLYASDFIGSIQNSSNYWNSYANEGIRLAKPEAGGALSGPIAPATSIFDTLGNANSGSACNVGSPAASNALINASIAAGANGAIWVLTEGEPTFQYEGSELAGREVIEFAPDGANACSGPTGTFSLVNAAPGSPAAQAASSPLTVPVDSTVDFDASTIKYPGGSGALTSIYAYEWNLTGSGFNTIDDTIETGAYQPPTTASQTYTTPGIYPVALKLFGDFGEYEETGTVIVQTTSPPVAAFTAPASGQTGQAVSFDASGSKPASGAQISDYHWSFGDGQSDDTQSAVDSHSYSTPGTYTVTLAVYDNDERHSQAVTQQITIANPSSSGNGGGSNGGTTNTTAGGGTNPPGPPVATIDRNPTNVSPKVTEVVGEIQVALSCPATKLSCAGTVDVKTAAAVAAKKAKKSVLALGSASFTLTGGATRKLTIKLSGKGAALLRKDRTLKVDIIVAARDSYGDPLTTTLVLTLREPARKPAAHKK
jgi:PKD repeat protein